jgi:hypothetical protein
MLGFQNKSLAAMAAVCGLLLASAEPFAKLAPTSGVRRN